MPLLRQMSLLAVAAATLCAACSSGHHSGAAAASHPGNSGSTSSTSSSVASGGQPTTTTPGAGAGGANSTTTSTPSPSSAGTKTPAPHQAALTKPGLYVAAGGVYALRQSGHMTAGSTTTNYPANASLTVTPAQNGQQAWAHHIQPGQPAIVSLLRVIGGSRLVQVTIPSPQGDLRCTLKPLVPAPVWPASVGASFSSKGQCGSTSISINGRVTAERSVSVSGKSYSSWVTDESFDLTGTVVGSGTQEDWYAPQLGLPAHETEQLSARSGSEPFTYQMTTDLLQAQPS